MDKRFGGARDTSHNTPRGRWEEHRARFEAYLEGLVFSEEPRLARLVEAMRYSMLGGGKRVRPTLCMEVADVFGAEPGLVLPSAAAIELIHTGGGGRRRIESTARRWRSSRATPSSGRR